MTTRNIGDVAVNSLRLFARAERSADSRPMERKIRPIYEALDGRQPKQALKLCDALLKKGTFHLVMALKADPAPKGLSRAGEAIELARQVGNNLKAETTDDHLLSTLLMTYRACGKTDEMVAASTSRRIRTTAERARARGRALRGVPSYGRVWQGAGALDEAIQAE